MKVDKPFRLLFFGSDQFSIRVLGHLLRRQICPIDVTTKEHTLLHKYAREHQLKAHLWPHDLEDYIISHRGNEHEHNIGLVASFGKLIDAKIVNHFPLGLFNVHPSLLPKYRGSTPVQTAIFDGIYETGCTIMRIPPVAKFDVGDIILQEKVNIDKREYAQDLRDRLADLGADLASHFLLNYHQCLAQAQPQDGGQKSLAKKLKPQQGHLKFKSESLELIDRKVRAYTGFLELYISCLSGLIVRLEGMLEPDLVESFQVDQLIQSNIDTLYYSDRQQQQQSVISHISHSNCTAPAGTMYFHKTRRKLCIKTADDKWTAFEWATPEGKARMSALDFYNGYLSQRSSEERATDC